MNSWGPTNKEEHLGKHSNFQFTVHCLIVTCMFMAWKTCTCSCYTSIISTFPTPILTYPSLSHLYGWPCLYVLIAAAMSSEAVPIHCRNLHKSLTLLKGQKGHDNFFSGWYYMALWRYNISLQRVANLAKLPWVTEREHSPKPYTKTLPLRVVGIFSLSILCRGLILLRNSKVQRTWWKSVNSRSATLMTNKEK